MANYIIGIGGTGSRCLESILHLGATGLGPDAAWVGLIDQDLSNGNVERAKALLGKYQKSRTLLKNQNASALPAATTLFQTNFTTSSDPVWYPLQGATPLLSEVFKYPSMRSELKGLMDCLYRPKGEQDLPLNVGFRGKPHIGAAAIISRVVEEAPLWRDVFRELTDTNVGQDTRIFLVGSIFGGMGASGFPTIARIIKAKAKAEGRQNTRIGGALMLPYFRFPPAPDEVRGMAADSAVFLEQTASALRYYENLFRRENVFDDLYLMGWDPLISLNYFKEGSGTQRNPPLVPELYAGLAATRFFSNAPSDTQTIFHIGCQDPENVKWDDLPAITGNEKIEVRQKLSQLVRFAVCYRYVYRPHLQFNGWKKIKGEAWFRNLLGGRNPENLEGDTIQAALKAMDDYCQELLEWVAAMKFASHGQVEVDLFNANIFADKDPDTPTQIANLKSELSNSGLREFERLAVGEAELSLAKIFERLTYNEIGQGNPGAGLFCGALYDSCLQAG